MFSSESVVSEFKSVVSGYVRMAVNQVKKFGGFNVDGELIRYILQSAVYQQLIDCVLYNQHVLLPEMIHCFNVLQFVINNLLLL